MSAYMVDREVINYIVSAAIAHSDSAYGFTWYHDGQLHKLTRCDRDRASEVGQMLWDANLKSIHARYPDTVANPDNIPGVIGETYIYAHSRDWGAGTVHFESVQTIKSVRCLMYQSCEYEGWEGSEAKAFLDALIVAAYSWLPGYDKAEWGAPADPTLKVRKEAR